MSDGNTVASMFVEIGASIGGFQSGMASVTSTLLKFAGISLSIAGAFEFGKTAIQAASEAQQADVMFAQALGIIGVTYDKVTASAHAYFNQLQQTTGFQDDQLENSTTRLIQVTGNYAQSLKLVALAADIARARHIDLQTATDLVGKVAEGNVSILKRYGISLDKGTSSATALAELSRRFGGESSAYMKTYAGKWDELKNVIHDVDVKLGNDLLPHMLILMGYVEKLITGFEKLSEKMPKWLTVGNVLKTGFSVLTGVPMAENPFNGYDKDVNKIKADLASVPKTANQAAVQSKTSFDSFFEGAKAEAQKFGEGFATSIGSAFQVFENGTFDITKAFESAIDQMIAKIIESGILNLVGLIFGGGGGAGFGILGNIFNVTPHAEGGVFTQPHVGLVAEAGPEAIIPLNKMGDLMKSNTTVHQTINVSLPSLIHTADASTVKQAVRQVASMFKQQGLATAQ